MYSLLRSKMGSDKVGRVKISLEKTLTRSEISMSVSSVKGLGKRKKKECAMLPQGPRWTYSMHVEIFAGNTLCRLWVPWFIGSLR